MATAAAAAQRLGVVVVPAHLATEEMARIALPGGWVEQAEPQMVGVGGSDGENVGGSPGGGGCGDDENQDGGGNGADGQVTLSWTSGSTTWTIDVTDHVYLGDSVKRKATSNRKASASVFLLDQVKRQATIKRAISDTLFLADATKRLVMAFRKVQDSLFLVDLIAAMKPSAPQGGSGAVAGLNEAVLRIRWERERQRWLEEEQARRRRQNEWIWY